MKNILLGTTVVSLLTLICSSALAQVEQVTSLTVTNPQALMSTITEYNNSGESNAQSVTLLANIHDGPDPATHTIVGLFEDLEDLENTMDERPTSAAWATLQRSFPISAKANGTFLAIQRRSVGEANWSEGDYLAATIVGGNDGAVLAAFDELERTSRVDIPGTMRVMRLRGGVGSHAFLASASSYEDLINFQEEIESSEAFATYQAANPATYITTIYYRVVKIWNP